MHTCIFAAHASFDNDEYKCLNIRIQFYSHTQLAHSNILLFNHVRCFSSSLFLSGFMGIGTGHRCVIVWLHILLVLVFLVVYLDRTEPRDPAVLFGIVAVTDILTLLGVIIFLIRAVVGGARVSFYFNCGHNIVCIRGHFSTRGKIWPKLVSERMILLKNPKTCQ